jgi:molybdopterin/thiamine biosynthesis adenylyltransferase
VCSSDLLFQTPDVGRAKVEVAVERLAAINPHVKISGERERLTPESASRLIAGANIVIDGTDNFATRFIVNETCHRLGAPLVSGAVGRWSAQVSVFRSGETQGKPWSERLPCYRCLVSEMPETEETCAVVGVIGPLTGIVGARMALETVKEITGAGDTLAGKLWLFDGLSGDTRTVTLRADPHCEVCGG